MKQTFTFREDGTFTIVQFTDVHWKNGGEEDLKSRALMKQVLEAEQPDLVVFTGDVVASYDCQNPIQAFNDAVSVVEQSRTPWAVIFGNHDTEEIVTRQELMKTALQHEFVVAEQGPEDIDGVGNYILSIKDTDGCDRAVLYFLDSGEYSSLSHVDGYAWIKRSQIDWYVQQSQQLTAKNSGKPLPSLAFFHIPLPEYLEVWENQVCYGHKQENVCCSKLNSGLFAAMVEMGDVMGTFAGHDHINDYWGELHGIRLCYGRATGHNTYGREGFPRGARVIRLRSDQHSFETWLRLNDGSVIMDQPEHQPEGKNS